MKIVIDNKIPFVEGVFEPLAEVVYAPGGAIDAAVVKGADALIVRTRTQCDAALLSGSQIKFIATATIGYDHISADYCAAQGVEWTSAPGCNADAVVQYVFSALGHLAKKNGFDVRDKVLGVVGVGNVGSRVAAFAENLGMQVLKNDPPRHEREGGAEFVSLDELKAKADIITFHTPLTSDGPHPTYHLCGDAFFVEGMKMPIIINASRGGVCSNETLKKASDHNNVSALVIDCWENEPAIDLDLLAQVDIGTFHIAGYSLEGKANATSASVRAVSRFFNLGMDDWQVDLPVNDSPCNAIEDRVAQVMCSYDIFADSRALKQSPDKFEELRGTYKFRRQPICL
jgi:erythronate-4-phosphate dehydrogenase